jgi:hypothetical protein
MDVVPIVSQSTAMNSPVIPVRPSRDTIQLPEGWLAALPVRRAVSRRSWERFVAVRINAAQALAMDPLLRVGALVILDRHYNSLAVCRPPHPNIYGLRIGAQLVFRHVSFESSRLIITVPADEPGGGTTRGPRSGRSADPLRFVQERHGTSLLRTASACMWS